MSQLSEQLERILEREHAIYEEVLDLAGKKKQIIIDGKLKELEEITRRETEIVGILIKLENLRSQTSEQLAAEKGVMELATVRDLLPLLDPKDQLAISTLHSKLKGTVTALQNANDLNGKLLKQSLELVDFNLNLINSIGSVSGGYTENASEKDPGRRTNLFDAKA